MFVFSGNSHVETRTPKVMVIGNEDLGLSDHEAGPLSDGISALIKRDTELSPPLHAPSPHFPMSGHRKKGAVCKTGESSLETELANILILDFQHSEPRENKFLLFKCPSLHCFVMAVQVDRDLQTEAAEGEKTG